MMIGEICQKAKCTGCGACESVCPQKCIELIELNPVGHIYPVINNQKCIDCGACVRACPQNTGVEVASPIVTYAAWSLNRAEHKASSSGGLGTYFARKVLEDNGIVYGCSSSMSDGKVKHIRCVAIEELEELRGSKYVQSNIEECYISCKKDLREGKEVVFIGLPCQIAGLKSFLKVPYENLLTIDLVCHGVAPQKILREHLSQIGVSQPALLSFRDESGMHLKIKEGGKTIYDRKISRDLYYMGFISGLYFRDSCYQCSYAAENRVGDLTIADFWGIDHENLPDDACYGVSLLLLNTEKGQKFLKHHKEGLFLEERSFQEASQGNKQLQKPSVRHKNADRFQVLYSRVGFERAAKSCLKKERIKYRVVDLSKNNKILQFLLRKVKKGR